VQDNELTFSKEEMDAAGNARFFYVKNEITQKIIRQFGILEKELMKNTSAYPFLTEAGIPLNDKGKIFRGENYRLLPYIILDCPRVFTTATVFAFRSMFWWGNEFSFTLHIQGDALEYFRKKILENIFLLKDHNFFFCINSTPWQYSFDKANYKTLDDLIEHDQNSLNEYITGKKFLKLSRKIEISQYADVPRFGVETFKALMKMLQG
jgi:hypothetical protein